MVKVIKFKIKELIDKNGYKNVSYRVLAEEMGIDHVSLWKMINGKEYNPSLATINRLCEFFECQPGDLLIYK